MCLLSCPASVDKLPSVAKRIWPSSAGLALANHVKEAAEWVRFNRHWREHLIFFSSSNVHPKARKEGSGWKGALEWERVPQDYWSFSCLYSWTQLCPFSLNCADGERHRCSLQVWSSLRWGVRGNPVSKVNQPKQPLINPATKSLTQGSSGCQGF